MSLSLRVSLRACFLVVLWNAGWKLYTVQYARVRHCGRIGRSKGDHYLSDTGRNRLNGEIGKRSQKVVGRVDGRASEL